jgi:hypothetical protein
MFTFTCSGGKYKLQTKENKNNFVDFREIIFLTNNKTKKVNLLWFIIKFVFPDC